MKWTRGHRSEQVEDRRAQGSSGGGTQLAGAGMALPMLLFRKFGVWGLVGGVALVYFMGGGLGGSGESSSAAGGSASGAAVDPEEQPMVEFVSFVLDDVQSTWQKKLGSRYQLARLVIFRGRTQSGCGTGQAETGPFYCPVDQKAYIDLSFYEELKRRFGAPGDFAQAYVMAHEIGHHLQNLLGAMNRVHNAPRSEQNGPAGLSTRLELQADCYSGVWARSAEERGLLEVGDLEEALRAAAAIGDDNIQRQSQGTVQPESWTHGSSEQRVRWFKTGYERGEIDGCDTFSVARP